MYRFFWQIGKFYGHATYSLEDTVSTKVSKYIYIT